MWKVIQRRVVYNTPLGWILAHFEDSSLTRLSLPQPDLDDAVADFPCGSVPQREIERLELWLEAYFAHSPSGELAVELAPKGTEFCRQVWRQTCQIPPGQTRSYGWVAKGVGKPKAARAVGGALRRNPLPLVIPCHRVISASGGLGGYGGSDRENIRLKASLLAWEGLG